MLVAREGEDLLIVAIYVDDAFCLYREEGPGSLYYRFYADFHAAWEAEDDGELHDMLNIQYEYGEGTLKLHQQRYIEKLSAEFFPDGVSDLRIGQTPYSNELPQLVMNAVGFSAPTVSPESHKRFRSMVGSIMYCATCTRPDIAYTVGMLARAMHCPTPELLLAADRALAYLYMHRSVGLTYAPDSRDPFAYSDSDWATRRSTTGWVVLWNKAAISWGSKQQPTVALSSCEAEIMAASKTAQEVVYLRRLVDELGFPHSSATSMAVDNKAARDTAYNPENHDKIKNVERRHLFIRECIENGQIIVPYVTSAENLADFFTQLVGARAFFEQRDMIMNVP